LFARQDKGQALGLEQEAPADLREYPSALLDLIAQLADVLFRGFARGRAPNELLCFSFRFAAPFLGNGVASMNERPSTPGSYLQDIDRAGVRAVAKRQNPAGYIAMWPEAVRKVTEGSPIFPHRSERACGARWNNRFNCSLRDPALIFTNSLARCSLGLG